MRRPSSNRPAAPKRAAGNKNRTGRTKSSAGRKNVANARPAEVLPVGARTIKRRMLFIGVALGLGLTLATARAVMLQTVESPELRREAARNYVRSETLDDWRGDIVDRQGALLAVTVHRWSVTVDPTQVKNAAETAAALAPILGLSQAEVHERIDPATARPVEEDQARNPATQLARKLTTPMTRLVSRVFGTPRAKLDRRLDLLEKFFQLEQLKNPAVFGIIETIAGAAENTAAAINADVDGLRFFPTRGRRFAYLAHDLDDTAVRRLNDAREEAARRCRTLREQGERCDNPLAQIYVRPEARRYYPKRDLAAQLVGLVGRESSGLSGVERGMDAILAGGQHQVMTIKDQRGRRILLDGIPADAPLGASSVVLTIDQQVQAVAEREVAKACLASGARAGYAVVMRIKTGEVLAVANFPTYNPNTFQDWFRDRQPLKDERAALSKKKEDLAFARAWDLNEGAFPGVADDLAREEAAALEQDIDAYVEYSHRFPNSARNTAFLDVYEPGSIMKVFTVAAALDAGVATLADVFELEDGDWELHDADDNVIHDLSRMHEGNLALILKKSSNIGAAKVGFRLGADRLESYLRGFGFGTQSGSGVPGEAKGILRPAAQWVPVELANVSFGQGMAATGIQLVTAVSALANEGRLMRPLVVKRIIDDAGKAVREFEPEVVRQVVSPKTARTVLDLMQGVIEPDGTGHRAYIPEFPVAGKTGTGQKPHLRKRGYSDEMWVNTFFGVAPANDPEIAIVVLVDEPTAKRNGGGLIAAPAFKPIMEFTLHRLGIASPYATAQRQAWLDPETLRRRRAEAPTDASEDDALLALAPPVAADQGADVPVPDFRGMTMDRVRAAAAEIGLDLRVLGSGVALTQDVPAYERVAAGTTVTVAFKTRAPGLRAPSLDPTRPLPTLPLPSPSGDALPPLQPEPTTAAGGAP
ncbi:MAG: hypothetical protein CVU56_07985 [Deltaproteobacteria bacterium HGW-Deltaproteobacteria-14]|nr:MAG: hypothetical protein CVU56_07985 [Deltaproteobacteria bacterium HGW-Deltaproteobacteria-14]